MVSNVFKRASVPRKSVGSFEKKNYALLMQETLPAATQEEIEKVQRRLKAHRHKFASKNMS